MVEFKKLSDVNVIETMNANTNVLVEENGEIVKIAANNLVPEDVVTQTEMEDAIAAIPEGFSGSWNDLEDKPFYEDLSAAIRFDGSFVTAGYNEASGIYRCNWRSVTDYNTTEDGYSVSVAEGNYTVVINGTTYATKRYIVFSNDTMSWGMYGVGNPNLYAQYWADSYSNIVIRSDVDEADAALPFFIGINSWNTSSWQWPELYTNTDFGNIDIKVWKTEDASSKALDEKFIPDTIARKTDIPEGFSGSWNDLSDKPFDLTEDKVLIPEDQYTLAYDGFDAVCKYYPEQPMEKFVLGDTYILMVDGKEYKSVGEDVWGEVVVEFVYALDGNTLRVSNIQDEYYQFRIIGGSTVTATMSFIHAGNIKRLDEKYMPLLTSPNGTQYKLTVSDDGTLSATAVT